MFVVYIEFDWFHKVRGVWPCVAYPGAKASQSEEGQPESDDRVGEMR